MLRDVDSEPGGADFPARPDAADDAFWSFACECGKTVEPMLARLGSARCQDCRDGFGQINDFLRRAA